MQITEVGKGKRFDVRLSPNPINVLFVSFVGAQKDHRAFRWLVIAAGATVLVLGFAMFIVDPVLAKHFQYSYPPTTSAWIILFGFVLSLSAALSGSRYNLFVAGPPESEARQEAESHLALSKDPYAVLDVDSKRLSEYYAINQSQARASFRWAVVAMLTGLVTIVAGFWIYYFRAGSQEIFLTTLTTCAGVLSNFVSGMYLYLHNKTQSRSLSYYGQLVRLQQLGLAIRLAESHKDAAQAAAAKDTVIRELLALVRDTGKSNAGESGDDGAKTGA